MKINDLLLESPRDQLALEGIGDGVVRYIERSASTLWSKKFLKASLKDMIPSKLMSHLYGRMRVTEVVVFTNNKGHIHGEYHHGLNSISLYLENFAEVSPTEIVWKNRKGFKTVVIHEFRHRLDHSLAKNKGYLSSMTSSPEYLKRETEVNARLSEVMYSLNQDLRQSIENGNVMSFNEYIDRFKYYGAQRDLLKIFANADNKELDTWVSYVNDGIFGRKIGVEVAGSLLKTDATRFNIHHPKYKRILTRLYKMYEHIVGLKA